MAALCQFFSIGLTLAHKKEHLIRSVLEGMAFNLKIILDAFEEQGARIEEVRVIGGGARGRLLRQIMADVYGRKILISLISRLTIILF